MPPVDREVDSLTYNPMADARPDNADFNDDNDTDRDLVGALCWNNQPAFRGYEGEDAETARSDQTGKIPRGMSMSSPVNVHF